MELETEHSNYVVPTCTRNVMKGRIQQVKSTMSGYERLHLGMPFYGNNTPWCLFRRDGNTFSFHQIIGKQLDNYFRGRSLSYKCNSTF